MHHHKIPHGAVHDGHDCSSPTWALTLRLKCGPNPNTNPNSKPNPKSYHYFTASVGTCESAVCIRIESQIESGVKIRIRIESRIESAVGPTIVISILLIQ